MTDPLTVLTGYLEACMRAMRLTDWTVEVRLGEPDADDAIAEIDPVYGRKWARLTVGDSFWNSSPGEKRHTVCHELVHLHLAGLNDVIQTDLAGHLAPSVYLALRDNLLRWLEYGTDGVADSFAHTLPEWIDPL